MYIYKHSGTAIIHNCLFDNQNFLTGNVSAIYLSSYKEFSIDGCTIKNYPNNGISLSNCDVSSYFDQIISNNWIYNNGNAGINSFLSFVQIIDNPSISNNNYGIISNNNSNVFIEGNYNAHFLYETSQKIKNNNINQLIASSNSFPYWIKWNAIYDDDTEQPLVVCSSESEKDLFDITFNAWGDLFNPELPHNYFSPIDYYTWIPFWDLPNPPPPKSDEEILFESAKLKVEQQDFSGAKSDYLSLVTSYPNSVFAQASLKYLLTLEKHVTNDYLSLKAYYLNDTSIHSNELLLKISYSLANWCDVYSENYQIAIDWFENVIEDPPSLEDSVFAIIDLGYVYFLMENGGFKSSYSCKYPQYKFTSQEEYSESVDFHLSLLYDDGLSETMQNNIAQLKTGELLQNVPNPFNSSTQLWYKLDDQANAIIDIFDFTGKKVNSINQGIKEQGSHYAVFEPSGMANGIYFYSLKVNGIVTDTKKMTLMK